MTLVTNEISVYKGQLTEVELVNQIAKVKKIFPKFNKESLLILKDRFADNHFNDERMVDAVNHVIDTYEGWDKLPNIANFISYDKTVKIYTQQDLLNESREFSPATRRDFLNNYGMINVGLETPRWCLLEHIKQFNLTKWK